jgi:glycosyltransferase involved in cell wall biosynthesis
MFIHKNNLPLVSVIIPVYNGEEYIQTAIESVIKQDYHNIEIIVLDDGSTDNTLSIIKLYSKIQWDSHSNMGQASTLNKGWEISKGDILGYLSADDILFQNAVSISVEYLNDNPDAIMTYCDFNLIDPDSNFIRKIQPPDFNYHNMVVNLECPPGPGVFFTKKAFEIAGGWNSNYRQMPDYEYWLRLGRVGRFVHIPEVLASFRIHESSQTFAKGDFKKSEEPITIIETFYNGDGIPESIKNFRTEAMANANLVSAQLHWRSGRFTISFLRLLKAIQIYPYVIFRSRIYKIAANALFNRAGHRLLRILKHLFHIVSNLKKNR